MNIPKNNFTALPFNREISDNGNFHNDFYLDSGHFSGLMPEHVLILQSFGISATSGAFHISAASAADFWNVNFILEGSLLLENGEQKFPLRTGDIFFSSAYDNKSLSDDKSKKAKWVTLSLYQTISSVLFREQALYSDSPFLRIPQPEKLHDILHKIMQFLKENTPDILPKITAFLYDFFTEIHLQNSYTKKITSWDILFSRIRRPPFAVSASSLAKEMGMPLRVFSRKFTEHFGLPPKKYLTKSRLAYASYLLIQENYPISEIATLCNYNDSAHFIHEFKNHTGSSPDQYRKMKRQIPTAFQHTILLNMAGGSNHDIKSSSKALSSRRQEILYLLKHNNKLSQRKLAKTLKINVSAVQAHLSYLKKNGYLQRNGPLRGGYWEVKKQ